MALCPDRPVGRYRDSVYTYRQYSECTLFVDISRTCRTGIVLAFYRAQSKMKNAIQTLAITFLVVGYLWFIFNEPIVKRFGLGKYLWAIKIAQTALWIALFVLILITIIN
jgi:hypothetical protein